VLVIIVDSPIWLQENFAQFHVIKQHSHDFIKEFGGFTGLHGFTGS
jgi:hypothetical protein